MKVAFPKEYYLISFNHVYFWSLTIITLETSIGCRIFLEFRTSLVSMQSDKRKTIVGGFFSWILHYYKSSAMLLNLIITASLFETMKVAGDGTFSLQLINYTNPLHLTSAGFCCEEPTKRFDCKSDCDNYFIVCISGEKNGNCSYGYYWLDETGRDKLIFPSSIWGISPSDIKNPMHMPVTKWQGSIYIKIEVYDNDFGVGKSNHLRNTHVETFFIDYTERPGSSDAAPKPFEIYVGKGSYATIYIGLRAQCKDNYLVPGCDVYCVDTDDARGHYTCDYKLGRKLCKSGWYGKDCTLKVPLCRPRDDVNGHYTCHNVTDEKVCLPGWKNPHANCTEAISSVNPSTSSVLQATKSSLSLAMSTKASVIEGHYSSLSVASRKSESNVQTSHLERQQASTAIRVLVKSSSNSQSASLIKPSQLASESFNFKSALTKTRSSAMEAVSTFTLSDNGEKKFIPTADQKGKRTLIYSSLIGPFLVLIVSVAILLTRIAYVRHRNRIIPMEASAFDMKANKSESPRGETTSLSATKTWPGDKTQKEDALHPNALNASQLMSTNSRKTQVMLQETGI